MKAIILAGGFGTRLQSIISDLPKPMAPIAGQPFLAYLLQYLARQGFEEVILSVHYQHEKIRAFFQENYYGLKIVYAHEKTPLGTGGAILHALNLFCTPDEPVFVLNGDTFLQLNYAQMWQAHHNTHPDITMALRTVFDCNRYGKVMLQAERIVAFQEKGHAGNGLINAGIYLLSKKLFSAFTLPAIFSFETDFIFAKLAKIQAQAFIADDYFIDIGIPADYARANQELPQLN